MAPDDGAVGAAKMGKKKKKKDDEGGKKTTKTDDDPFGKPDEYPDAAAAIIGSKHLVEFHERSDPTKTLATYSMSFGEKLLPREQVMCWQQIIVFNQMVGRMLDTTSKFAYHTDYVELLAKLCEGVKKVRLPLTGRGDKWRERRRESIWESLAPANPKPSRTRPSVCAEPCSRRCLIGRHHPPFCASAALLATPSGRACRPSTRRDLPPHPVPHRNPTVTLTRSWVCRRCASSGWTTTRWGWQGRRLNVFSAALVAPPLAGPAAPAVLRCAVGSVRGGSPSWSSPGPAPCAGKASRPLSRRSPRSFAAAVHRLSAPLCTPGARVVAGRRRAFAPGPHGLARGVRGLLGHRSSEPDRLALAHG